MDYTGVFVAYPEDLLGLHPPGDTLTGEKPDYQIHELKKFCDLLIKGNPGIIEMLFTDRFMWSDSKWKPLQEVRKKFLCHNVVKQYLGYSMAQLQRLRHGKSVHSKGGIPGEKWSYHMVRVAWDAERIAMGGEPKVWKDGEEKDKLMAIRTGAWTTEQAVKEAETTIARIDSAKPWPIPETADEKFLNEWLLWIRGVKSEISCMSDMKRVVKVVWSQDGKLLALLECGHWGSPRFQETRSMECEACDKAKALSKGQEQR